MPDISNIEAKRSALNAVIDEQYRYPREVLGKTRRLHPNEFLRYTPYDLSEREREARDELSALLWDDATPILKRALRSRRIPDRNEVHALAKDYISKSKHSAMLRDLGTEFVPASEIVEARIAAEVAYQLYCIALDKNGAQNISECRMPKRRMPMHRDAVDGFVKTGRYKMIDGVRVPVVKSVRVQS